MRVKSISEIMVVYLSVTQNNGNVGQTVNGKTISFGSTDREIFEDQ